MSRLSLLLAIHSLLCAGCAAVAERPTTPRESSPEGDGEVVRTDDATTAAGASDAARGDGTVLASEVAGGPRTWVGPDGARHALAGHVADELAPRFATERDSNLVCLHDTDCTAGRAGVCREVAILSGVPQPRTSRCEYDACQADGDCGAPQLCIPAGYAHLPSARCVVAQCRRNADCVAHARGRCEVLPRWTGSPAQFYAPEMIAACVYAGAPCTADRACAQGSCFYYERDGAPVCQTARPVP